MNLTISQDDGKVIPEKPAIVMPSLDTNTVKNLLTELVSIWGNNPRGFICFIVLIHCRSSLLVTVGYWFKPWSMHLFRIMIHHRLFGCDSFGQWFMTMVVRPQKKEGMSQTPARIVM